jgi:hypothetical protein
MGGGGLSGERACASSGVVRSGPACCRHLACPPPSPFTAFPLARAPRSFGVILFEVLNRKLMLVDEIKNDPRKDAEVRGKEGAESSKTRPE